MRFLCIILTVLLSFCSSSFAAEKINIEATLSDTAKYVYETVKNPEVGSVGGEWAILGLARSGYDVPGEYYRDYYENVKKYVISVNGNLHNKKYTEYSRLLVALTAIGKNPSDVAGYNLMKPLGDYEKTVWQGINGPVWALIALDCGNYEMPVNENASVQATREMYINKILESQTSDGGWALTGDIADVDVTGMALQALSKYRDNENVNNAIERALICMSQKQNENGGFSSWSTENSESCVQMIVALSELGVPISDERFVKKGKTIFDSLYTYYTPGNGFMHVKEGSETNLMATEQALYCMAALDRFAKGQNSLYSMSDAITVAEKEAVSEKTEEVYPIKTFSDIAEHKNKTAIESLASRGIINGKSEKMFEPDATMTRAEFATIVVNALNLPGNSEKKFSDVNSSDWFFSYVNTAYAFGIVNGISETEFNPNGTITREEAAVMLTRAVAYGGVDTEIDVFEARNILAQFFDYVKASDWAISSLAFSVREGIVSDEVMEIKPKEDVKRGEIAQMIYNMLEIEK